MKEHAGADWMQLPDSRVGLALTCTRACPCKPGSTACSCMLLAPAQAHLIEQQPQGALGVAAPLAEAVRAPSGKQGNRRERHARAGARQRPHCQGLAATRRSVEQNAPAQHMSPCAESVLINPCPSQVHPINRYKMSPAKPLLLPERLAEGRSRGDDPCMGNQRAALAFVHMLPLPSCRCIKAKVCGNADEDATLRA